jgi:LCP family protein required for cell wall assembly
VQYTRYTVAPRKPVAPAWVRVLKWTVLVIVVATAATVGMGIGYLQNAISTPSHDKAASRIISSTKPTLTKTHGTHAPVNILVLGSDRRTNIAGDKGRSDTIMLVRIDPGTKSISMLSIPRDLRVEIPGYGTDRINAAYSYGGPALSVKTFKALTGLPVNHFMDINFDGFKDVVNYLGGVYLDVDRQYYNNTAITGFSSIDIKAGYQRLDGADALAFVRYRHDQLGDWGRMQRQQMFLREIKRQALRWQNVFKLPQLIKLLSKATITDVTSLRQLITLAQLAMSVDTTHIYQVHLEGHPIVVNGADELEASPAEVAAVVDQFMHPERPPVQQSSAETQVKTSFTVTVSNGGAAAGSAAACAHLLAGQGYRALVAGDVVQGDTQATTVYATEGYIGNARILADMLPPSHVVTVPRAAGVQNGVAVVLGSSYTGSLVLPQTTTTTTQTGPAIEKHVSTDASEWRQLSSQTHLKVYMPTSWPAGYSYEWSMARTYSIPASHGNTGALVVVGTTTSGGYWHIEEMRWLDPPAIASPDAVKTVKGVKYLQFYNDTQLHMVAWVRSNTLCWLTNTLDDTPNDEISNAAMMALATSFTRVK